LRLSSFLDTNEEPKPGIRSQIDVADYNGDGRLDLLVGDFCTYVSPRADLSKAERRELADLRTRLDRLEPAVAERNRKIQEEMKKFWAWFDRAPVWVTRLGLVPAIILARSVSEGPG